MRLDAIKFDKEGLIPTIVQDVNTRRVLTLAYMNAESFDRTLQTKETWFWSRSRQELWHKGATSGNTQKVVAVTVDCDLDALVIAVEPHGPACHTGAESCFHNQLQGEPDIDAEADFTPNGLGATLTELYALVETRKRERPERSYTTYLFDQGLDKILKKVGEEATETIIAAKGEDTESLIRESADLIYHLIVLLVERGVDLDQVNEEMVRRRAKAGGA